MKTLTLVLLLFGTSCFAQDVKYTPVMERTILQMDSAKDVATLQSASNTFERISIANSKEWLPLYYQSYCYIMMGMRMDENAKKDENFDRAEQLISKADSISPNNSEIYVLKGLITSMKIGVDPATRGQKLGMQAGMYNSKALELDKENPRAYLMKGTGLMYTPPQFGGGKDKALPVLEEAVAKFKTFKPANSIMPHWGAQRANVVLEQCKKTE